MKNLSSFIKESDVSSLLTNTEIENFATHIVQKCAQICDEHFIDGNHGAEGSYKGDPGVAFTNFFFPATQGKKQSTVNLYRVLSQSGVEISPSEHIEEFVALIVDQCKTLIDKKFVDGSYDEETERPYKFSDPRFGREQFSVESFYSCDIARTLEKHFDCPTYIKTSKSKPKM